MSYAKPSQNDLTLAGRALHGDFRVAATDLPALRAAIAEVVAQAREEGRREVLAWLRANGGDPADYSVDDVGQYLAERFEQEPRDLPPLPPKQPEIRSYADPQLAAMLWVRHLDQRDEVPTASIRVDGPQDIFAPSNAELHTTAGVNAGPSAVGPGWWNLGGHGYAWFIVRA